MWQNGSRDHGERDQVLRLKGQCCPEKHPTGQWFEGSGVAAEVFLLMLKWRGEGDTGNDKEIMNSLGMKSYRKGLWCSGAGCGWSREKRWSSAMTPLL
jgi:hypothetical protein